MTKNLEINDTVRIAQGHRNNTIMWIASSLLFRHSRNHDEKKLRTFFDRINNELCDPEPLPDNETESIWNSAVKFVEANIREQQVQSQAEAQKQEEQIRSLSCYDPKDPCVSYPVAHNRRIESTKDYRLVEMLHKSSFHKSDSTVTEHDLIVKTYTACKPVEIIKHRNPLSFLNIQQKYTFKLKGPEKSGTFTAAFKTLPEIVSSLKDGNAMCDLGLNVAINAQLKGFEHDKLLKKNDDMDLTGFFPDNGQDSKAIICRLEEI
jgi:hypothetical protein